MDVVGCLRYRFRQLMRLHIIPVVLLVGPKLHSSFGPFYFHDIQKTIIRLHKVIRNIIAVYGSLVQNAHKFAAKDPIVALKPFLPSVLIQILAKHFFKFLNSLYPASALQSWREFIRKNVVAGDNIQKFLFFGRLNNRLQVIYGLLAKLAVKRDEFIESLSERFIVRLKNVEQILELIAFQAYLAFRVLDFKRFGGKTVGFIVFANLQTYILCCE